ncbi:E3 ubiquitin-protein ligase ariadne-1 [Drosophila guanche]|uniref:RBR-type E3 ubiquitin transferase n=1 Tax=Drosophila guanche TaxID=7266 RepID=A0A3B0K7E4_DROGU|nr:E3 ubiquitin-protein ligase ariadne-1 [Drosophila guanche]SPP90025.1 blast:Protein ariadne-1 [Drosophila guanche]
MNGADPADYSDEDHGDADRSPHRSCSGSPSPSIGSMCTDSEEDSCTEIVLLEQESSPSNAEPEDDFNYEVLSVKQIVQHQWHIIDEVNSVLNLPPQITRCILNHYKWDKEKLFEEYFDISPEEFFQRAHLVNPFTLPPPHVSFGSNSLSLDPQNMCGICCCPSDDLRGLACGHRFCAECWKHYLASKTFSEGLGHNIACPAEGCDIVVDYVSFLILADNSEVIARHQQLITNTFVECNPLLRWCPAPSCCCVIQVSSPEARAVRCKCGHQFCFGCGENWHEPASCCLLKQWLKKCREDSETSNWIAQNTKECPKCNVTIEKDGGCNHMVCKNPNCRYDFCWVCLGSWEPHGSSWYSCNRFDEEEAKKARLAQQLYRSTMARYLHYYNRYMNHMQSGRLEHNIYAQVQAKMKAMRETMTWFEVQFLEESVEVLCQCRLTLMYSYVFAYYLRNNNQKIIFEDNQRDLESATEKISECLEREITALTFQTVRQKVLDLSHYCERRRTVLLCHVREGYEKDWWDFTADTATEPDIE